MGVASHPGRSSAGARRLRSCARQLRGRAVANSKVPLKMELAATVDYFRKTLRLDAKQAATA